MTYHVETEGNFWGALPQEAKGNVNDLPAEHQQALTDLFANAKEYGSLPDAKNANDATKYAVTLQQNAQTKTVEVNDAQLKHLPGPVADAIIFLSNQAKGF